MDVFLHLFSRDDDAYDQGPRLSATTTTILVLATVFIGLRLTARWMLGKLYGLDDWVMVSALIVCFATGGINYGMIASGLGRHASTLSLAQQEQFFKLLLAFECVYVTGVGLVKISVLLMYLRIFPSRNFRIAAAVIGATVVSWWIAIVLLCIFQCKPISKAWLPWSDGVCINLKASVRPPLMVVFLAVSSKFIANAIPNIATDVAILSMPVGQVIKLQVNVTQKLMVLGMFGLGSFVLFASIYRFTTIMQFEPADTTWTLATACSWCVVEIGVGIISGCLPTLRPLMMKISRNFGSSMGTKTAGTGHSGPGSRNPTELVTFGGTGGSKTGAAGRQFHRLQNDHDKYGPTTMITRSESTDLDKGSSDDELPLRDGIRVQVQHEQRVSEATTDPAELSYNQKYSNYRGL